MKTLVLPFLFLLVLFVSCQQDDLNVLESKVNSVDVYIAGTDDFKACYWKNNVKIILPGGDNIVPEKIIVENNNIYVFGRDTELVQNFYFWKNGIKYDVAQYLGTASNTSSTPTNIYINDFKVYNGNIYFLGFVKEAGATNIHSYCYWKDTNKTVLHSQQNLLTSLGLQLILHNNKVYITSLKYPTLEPGYYINNVYTSISTSNNLHPLGITANTNGVFVQIYDQTLAKSYYKNLETNLNFYQMSNTQSLALSDSINIYSPAGQFYYKNGNQMSFNITDGFKDYIDMKVLNENMYTIRKKFEQIDISYRAYINGVQIKEIINRTNNINLGGSFNSIFVVEH